MKKILKVSLPPYTSPRNEWRRKIHKAVSRSMNAGKVTYAPDDRFAVDIELHMTETMLGFHDVDNRLKDVLDALQGRMGGSKKVHAHTRLISNDKQVFEVVIKKVLLSTGSRGGGILKLRRIRQEGL